MNANWLLIKIAAAYATAMAYFQSLGTVVSDHKTGYKLWLLIKRLLLLLGCDPFFRSELFKLISLSVNFLFNGSQWA